MDSETKTTVLKEIDKRLAKRLAILVTLMLISIAFINLTASNLFNYVPLLPTFTLVTSSATLTKTAHKPITNSYDLKTKFLVQNPNPNSLTIFFKTLEKIEITRANAVTIELFIENATVRFYGNGHKSPAAKIGFRFSGRVLNEGNSTIAYWLKREIGIEVVCEQERVLVIDYDRNKIEFGPVIQCRVMGLWFKDLRVLIWMVLFCVLACIVCFFVLLAFEVKEHEIMSVMTQNGIAWQNSGETIKTV